MALSNNLQRSLLACLSFFICISICNAQNFTSEEVYSPNFGMGSLDQNNRAFSVHVTPTKYFCGELPVMICKQISNALVVELGGGPTFRDRVAEQLFNGDVLQNLPFISKSANYKTGFGVQAGVRYLISKSMLEGFYLNPEIGYTNRVVNYAAALNGRAYEYEGNETAMNIRLLLGYDRLMSSYSKHLFYGGYIGFGMRRYQANYFVIDNNDPGTRSSTEMIPTMHLGYRLGWKF